MWTVAVSKDRIGRTGRLGVLIGVCAAIIVGAASSARAADRVYWGTVPGISFANLDGSGGSDLNLTGTTTTQQALGLAVDSATGRISWASAGDFGAVRVSFVNLNGSGGGGGLNITGATSNEPGGLAIDPVARRVYWGNTNASNATLGTISRR